MKCKVNMCSDSTCSICMNEMTEFTFQLPCQHVFHSMCLLNWISKGKTTCPLCRQEFIPQRTERDNGAGVFLDRTNYTQRVLELEHYRNVSDLHNIMYNNQIIQRQSRNEARHRREHDRRRRRLFRSNTNNHRNANIISLSLFFRKVMVYLIRPRTTNIS